MNEIINEIDALREDIRSHDYKYYVEASPIISDYEYDQLLHRLIELEKAYPELITIDSPTQRVSGKPLEVFAPVTHKTPMLSLDNTYSIEELEGFNRRVCKGLGVDEVEYVVELKIDGVGVCLIYQNGQFYQGASRGDGTTGDDITLNLRTIRQIPLSINLFSPDLINIEVRGEVYMFKSGLNQLNAMRVSTGETPFANTRNATAGSLHLLNPQIVVQRPLGIFIHSAGYIENAIFSTYSETIDTFVKMGLPVIPYRKICYGISDVIDYCNEWEGKYKDLDYDVDGMVIKVNLCKYQKLLGNTAKSPRWAIAYKFKAQRAQTKLKEIIIQVGRTGALTPVAILEPIPLAGVIISRATLHNEDEIRRIDIRVGDDLIVERSGEVIPKIIGVIPAVYRNSPFEFPDKCPQCGADVFREEGEAKSFCTGVACPAQLRRRIEYFASRTGMDIVGLGSKIVDELVEDGIVTNIIDIYTLKDNIDKIEGLLKKKGWGKRSVENLLESIEASRTRPLDKLINALGIFHVGSKMAQVLADKFGSIEALSNVGYNELITIPDVGEKTAKSIHTFFSQSQTKELIDRLKEMGVSICSKIEVGDQFADKEFVITGSLKRYTRLEAEAIIQKYGGRASSRVNKRTDYLIVGEKPGGKLADAIRLGISQLTEDEFLALLPST